MSALTARPSILMPILMYHSISERATPGFRRFAITASEFSEQMGYLAEQRYRSMTLHQAMTTPPEDIPPRPIVLTFDDAFSDFHDTALPILEQHRLVATLYVPTAYVGGTSHWLWREGEGDRRMLTWDQLRDISQRGIECGGHSHSHPQLDLIPPLEAREEILRCKLLLEEQVNRPVFSFAYPHGYHTSHVRQMVRDAGYGAACAVRTTLGPQDRYALARRTVEPGMTGDRFRACVEQGRAPIRRGVEPMRALAWRAARMTRLDRKHHG